ncbi:3-deoxy-D-manno-octulosonic acid transferase [Pseudooceanicola batsensis HTCC2597]|uniref:3-deoxy-D-manno-octulosonic acid transferase n=1 Tax=Pseudooceanicola batsensis (strain ATCC BAA-863 / DSM 15984 / KCTC 12145 / HTCC2597) TaxID=252305 RepID=A3U1J4_PSEBH|nr:3-deoxy-D-manno-octulosonic acid transferase [Pseudooceanicola batsensis]EAQ01775.1 3-deoxy-D-manno-octulosonic acid transferase [Pseudooceanicola batsensis HTCC2597]
MAARQPQGTVFYQFYRGIAALTAPLVWRRVSRKLARHGVSAPRRRERLGEATLPRPEGPLIWFHAASVGESLSVLTLASRLQALQPGSHVLITSGTASSAEILGKRMPEDFIHQFAPLDQRAALRRFLDHWRPDAGIFVESEIWPQMLAEAHGAGVPLALVNARMSRASLKNWARFDQTARYLLGLFRVIRTQDRATLEGLLGIGADPSVTALGPNLKSVALPLPVDPQEVRRLGARLPAQRWLAASTHPGEERIVLEAHRQAREALPDLGLILAPRHPERAGAIAEEVRAAGLTLARRSLGEDPASAEVYLADTLGEMGLWYDLCPVVFLGGSFVSAGGHNPFEPAQAGCAVITGPRHANFADVYRDFTDRRAVEIVPRPKGLGGTVVRMLREPAAVAAQSEAAARLVSTQDDAVDALAALLAEKLLG